MPKRPSDGTRRVRGSSSGRPIMALLDLLGRRWSLRILWELREQTLTSRELRTACDEASPTVVQARLTELRDAGFIDLAPEGGYGLTPLGQKPAGEFPAAVPLRRALEQTRLFLAVKRRACRLTPSPPSDRRH